MNNDKSKRRKVNALKAMATTPRDNEIANKDSEPSPPSSTPTLDYPNTPSKAILPKNATEPPTPLSANSTNSSLSHHHSPGGSIEMIEGGSIMNGHREIQYFHSNSSWGLQKQLYREFNPFDESDKKKQQQIIGGAIQITQKSPVETQKPVQGAGKSKSSILGKREHPNDSPSNSDESDPKRQALGDMRNMGTIIVADPRPKIPGEQELLGAKDGERSSSSDVAVDVEHEMKGNGEYVLSIKRVSRSSRREEDKVERAKQMAQKASVLLLYGEMLLQMGNKLRAHSRATLYSVFEPPAASNSESDVD